MTKRFLKTIAVVISISLTLLAGTGTAWGMWKAAIENLSELELRGIINNHYVPQHNLPSNAFRDHKPSHQKYRDDLNELKQQQNRGTTAVTADLPTDTLQYRIWTCKTCSDMILDKEASRRKNAAQEQK